MNGYDAQESLDYYFHCSRCDVRVYAGSMPKGNLCKWCIPEVKEEHEREAFNHKVFYSRRTAYER